MITIAVVAGAFVGRHARKAFKGHGMFEGVALAYDPVERLYKIGYTDAFSQEMAYDEV